MEGCLSFKTHSPFWRDKISRRPNFCTLCFSTVLWHLSVHPSLEQFSRVSADLPLTFLTFLKFCPHYLSKLSFMCQINENHELVLVLETWWIYWVSKTLCSCWRPPPPHTHTQWEFSMHSGGMVLSPPGATSRSLHMNLWCHGARERLKSRWFTCDRRLRRWPFLP